MALGWPWAAEERVVLCHESSANSLHVTPATSTPGLSREQGLEYDLYTQLPVNLLVKCLNDDKCKESLSLYNSKFHSTILSFF